MKRIKKGIKKRLKKLESESTRKIGFHAKLQSRKDSAKQREIKSLKDILKLIREK